MRLAGSDLGIESEGSSVNHNIRCFGQILLIIVEPQAGQTNNIQGCD